MLPAIESPAGLLQTVTASVTKLCPVKNEVDHGTVTITYVTLAKSFELHALAEHLASYADVAISHEAFTRQLADLLGASVKSAWTTAGMNVICEDHRVLRQSLYR